MAHGYAYLMAVRLMILKQLSAPHITAASGIGSVGTGAVTWLVNLNEVLQLVSLAISIFLGIYAVYRIFFKKNNDSKSDST